MLVSFDYQDKVLFQSKITKFITESVGVIILRCDLVCEVRKIEAFVHQLLPGHCHFFSLQTGFQDSPVLAKGVVDISDVVVGVAVLLVVVSIPGSGAKPVE